MSRLFAGWNQPNRLIFSLVSLIRSSRSIPTMILRLEVGLQSRVLSKVNVDDGRASISSPDFGDSGAPRLPDCIVGVSHHSDNIWIYQARTWDCLHSYCMAYLSVIYKACDSFEFPLGLTNKEESLEKPPKPRDENVCHKRRKSKCQSPQGEK